MNDQSVNSEILSTASSIGTAVPDQALQGSQLEFWVAVKATMANNGYEAVRKRFPFISQKLAQAICQAPANAILELCNPHMSTLRPALPDETLIELLAPNQDVKAKAILQLMSQPSLDQEVQCA